MTTAPIASTDLCLRGLHRVRVILVHLFAHPDRLRPPTALRTNRNRSRHQEETGLQPGGRRPEAATSPPNPNVNRQDPPGERPDSGITYRSDCGILRDLFGNPVQDVHIGAQMAVLARIADRNEA